MGKNIVILIGSPRPKGSSAALARAFAEGARSAGHNVTEFFLGGMDIQGCKACRGGRSDRDFPCVQHDGMDEIYPAVRGCDVLVLASPLYYWNLSGPLMTAINRLFALEEGGENLLRGHGRASALLMSATGHDFGDVLGYYDHLLEHLKWQNLGHVLAGGGPVDATTTLSIAAYKAAFQSYNFGESAAIGVIWMVFLFVLTFISNKANENHADTL